MLIEDVNQAFLIEKLGERWVVEMGAVSLYDAVMDRAREAGIGGDLLDHLQKFQEQERKHAIALAEVLRRFGRGTEEIRGAAMPARREIDSLLIICRDPDASFDQALQALLDAELIDGAAWELLEELCKRATIDEDVVRFVRKARRQVRQHLAYVRTHLFQRAARTLELPHTP